MTCDLNQSADQRQIMDSASSLLETSFPLSRSLDDDRNRLCDIAEFGGFALALDEELGGAGFSLVEETLLHVQLGRHVVSTGALAAPIGARLAHELGDFDTARSMAAGETAACVGLLSGDKVLLIDAKGADLAILFTDDGLQLIEFPAGSNEAVEGLGHGQPLAVVPADAIRRIGKSAHRSLLDLADLLVSAQLLGIAQAARDLAVAYAKVRRQFGKPIGSFQAIKHYCADMAISAEMLSAQLDMAAIALRDRSEDSSFQTAAVRLLAPQVAIDNARLCIQIHGGIGFSAEADPHRYLKQAHVLRQLGTGSSILEYPSPMAPHRPA